MRIGVLRLAFSAACPMLALIPSALWAQNRTNDNAVTNAQDGFGFSVGRESLGIYSATNTRGFSPTAAGNLRIEGLYFNSVVDLQSTIQDSTSIKVGLSAQGYPFAAPSGIVDQSLRRPDDHAGASVVINGDSLGSYGVEVDGSLPINRHLSLGYGLTAARTAYPDGTKDAYALGQALILRWRPSPGIEILPFWSLYNDYKNEVGTFYVPAGSFLPPQPPEDQYDGPRWAAFRLTAANYGTLMSWAPAKTWLFRLGIFRSVNDQLAGYTNLLEDLQPDGAARRIVIADPREKNTSTSGEIRVTHDIAEGPRLHVIHLSLRGRDVHHQFGGSDQFDLGPAQVGVIVDPPKPSFSFGPVSRDHVGQVAYGAAYDGRWRNVGELSLSVSRTDYDKSTVLPGVASVVSRSRPWLYNGTIAAYLSGALSIYAGYARGLEDSGLAPQNASNRNEPLPAILTEQKDAGIRWHMTGDVKLIAGVFDLQKPYFGYDAGGRYTQVGSTRSRGAEISVSGKLTNRIDIVAGGVFLDPKVQSDPAAQGTIGARPVGLSARTLNLNLNWRTPILNGLAFDVAATERSAVTATTDNLVSLPARTSVNLGTRYQFRLAQHSATLRVQANNVFDVRGFLVAAPGVYGVNVGRYVTGYLAIDL